MLGVVLCLLANVGINVGTNLLKVAHNRREVLLAEADDAGLPPPPGVFRMRIWQVGFTLFKLSNVLNFVAFGFAPQSVLAALASVQFVSNVMFARLVLGEAVPWVQCIGVGIIIAGNVVLVTFGVRSSKEFEAKDLPYLFSAPAFLAYASLATVVALSARAKYVASKTGVSLEDQARAFAHKLSSSSRGRDFRRLTTSNSLTELSLTELNNAAGVEAAGPPPGPDTPGADVPAPAAGPPRPRSAVLPFVYAVYSAIPGTLTVMFGKACAVLLATTIKGDSQLVYPMTYVFIVGLIVTGVFWDRQVNQGLRLFKAATIVPIMHATWTVLCIISGGLYYQELQQLKGERAWLFTFGLFVILGGMSLLVPRSAAPAGSPEDEESGMLSNPTFEDDGGEQNGSANALQNTALNALEGLTLFAVPTLPAAVLEAERSGESVPTVLKLTAAPADMENFISDFVSDFMSEWADTKSRPPPRRCRLHQRLSVSTHQAARVANRDRSETEPSGPTSWNGRDAVKAESPLSMVEAPGGRHRRKRSWSFDAGAGPSLADIARDILPGEGVSGELDRQAVSPSLVVSRSPASEPTVSPRVSRAHTASTTDPHSPSLSDATLSVGAVSLSVRSQDSGYDANPRSSGGSLNGSSHGPQPAPEPARGATTLLPTTSDPTGGERAPLRVGELLARTESSPPAVFQQPAAVAATPPGSGASAASEPGLSPNEL